MKGVLIEMESQKERRVVRAASGHHVGFGKSLHGSDDAHNDIEKDGRRQHGQCNGEELGNFSRAVNVCRLIQLLRHSLQSSQIDDHGDAYIPEALDDKRSQHQLPVIEPVSSFQPHQRQAIVHDPQLDVIHPHPNDGPRNAADNSRQIKGRAPESETLYPLIQQQRQPQGQHLADWN